MTADDAGAWQEDLARLRERLDQLERQHAMTLESLRSSLADLENRAAVSSPVREIPPAVSMKALPPIVAAIPEPQPPPLPLPLPVSVAVEAPKPVAPAIIPPPPLPLEESGSFELQLGRVWLVRLGIVLLLTGLVLLGNFAYKNWIHDLPPGVRLLGLFLCAGVLAELGRRLAAKESTKIPGEVILAGGLSFFYYCTFAAHQVERLKVIESPVIAAILLLAAAGGIAVVSWIRNARATAVLGLLLASYSTMMQPIGWLSCVSSIALAAAGLFLMRRPGWAGPGVASMVGTYGAFLGWQLLGASRGELRDPAVLWFLPPVWAMFSLPGLLGNFRESMIGRARAWFTGCNNAAFFLMFSGLWVNRFGAENYWQVVAVFGLVLLALGVVGRRASEIAGGVNLSQGLILVSWALVLKLDGFHLTLALAVESLSLAFAFAKFRGRSELWFSVITAIGAAGMALAYERGPGFWPLPPAIPVWSAGVAGLLIAAASVVLRVATDRCEAERQGGPRLAAGALFFTAVAVGIVGWSLRLPSPWPLPVLAGLATLLSAGSLLVDRSRKMPEICMGSLLFLLAAMAAGVFIGSVWSISVGGAFALAGTWLWHREDREISSANEDFLDLKNHSEFLSWIFSAVTVMATWWALQQAHFTPTDMASALGMAGLALIGAGVVGRCERLAACAALLHVAGLGYGIGMSPEWIKSALGSAGFALATLLMLHFLKPFNRMVGAPGQAAVWLLRLTTFAALCAFWWDFTPTYFGDGLALMALGLTAFALVRKSKWVVEIWNFLGIAILWLMGNSIQTPWAIIAEPSWRGLGIVIAALVLLIGARSGPKTPEKQSIVHVLGPIVCLLIGLWATKMLVWRHDWNGVSVLWTLLGFAFVSVGLWVRLSIFRKAGFTLLGLAVLKVFAFDVWDFNAFMRVVSFIVLGAALILLGLFYNRFASVVKRLLDDEESPATEPDK